MTDSRSEWCRSASQRSAAVAEDLKRRAQLKLSRMQRPPYIGAVTVRHVTIAPGCNAPRMTDLRLCADAAHPTAPLAASLRGPMPCMEADVCFDGCIELEIETFLDLAALAASSRAAATAAAGANGAASASAAADDAEPLPPMDASGTGGSAAPSAGPRRTSGLQGLKNRIMARLGLAAAWLSKRLRMPTHHCLR